MKYAEFRGRLVARTGEVLLGSTLPRRAVQLAEEWRRLHVQELVATWEELRSGRVPRSIDPLP
ncbi:MAG TPA: hypothetical protein VED59_02825 [Acidimicrobiales bacterium]|nr:hypothetical protein [Acidimicrobiales bacterium]